MMNTYTPVIVHALRTPFGKSIRGKSKNVRSDDMAALVFENLLQKFPSLSTEQIDEVILGCGFPEGPQGMNVARVAMLQAGIKNSTPAMTINRFCASGLESIAICADRIRLGRVKTALAGGLETMSMISMTGSQPRPNPRLIAKVPELYFNMGLTAERVAEEYKISREAQDLFALESHKKATRAIDKGIFKQEIIPLKFTETVLNESEDLIEEKYYIDTDEGPRRDTTLEAIGSLRPAFKVDGTVTAGNASPMSDGAAAVLLMEENEALKNGIIPLARIIDYVVVGTPPEVMGIGPVKAISKLLERQSLKIDDIDLFEINEAFAAQVLAVKKELCIPSEKFNVNGGAIALGHPLGATGARLVGTLIYEMKRRNVKLGIVSMCVGGGMGAAALIENL